MAGWDEMDKKYALLREMLQTPSPTGHESEIQRLIFDRMEKYAERVEWDVHGNMFFGLNTGARRSVMIEAHCDQVGFMVKHVDDNGYIYVDPLGGIDEIGIAGSEVVILGAKERVRGSSARKRRTSRARRSGRRRRSSRTFGSRRGSDRRTRRSSGSRSATT